MPWFHITHVLGLKSCFVPLVTGVNVHAKEAVRSIESGDC